MFPQEVSRETLVDKLKAYVRQCFNKKCQEKRWWTISRLIGGIVPTRSVRRNVGGQSQGLWEAMFQQEVSGEKLVDNLKAYRRHCSNKKCQEKSWWTSARLMGGNVPTRSVRRNIGGQAQGLWEAMFQQEVSGVTLVDKRKAYGRQIS